MNEIIYSDITPVICYTLLGLMVVVGMVVFSTTNAYSHIHRCALSELIRATQGRANHVHETAAKQLLSNMVSDKVVHNSCALKELNDKYKYYHKESAERGLSPKQQLILMDRLLGLKTNVRQASKIVRTRTVKDIVYLASKAIMTNNIKNAPVDLFH